MPDLLLLSNNRFTACEIESNTSNHGRPKWKGLWVSFAQIVV